MKNTKTSQIMRWTAAALYTLLCVYQMFSMRFTIITLPNTSVAVSQLTVTWVAELVLMLLAGVLAVWMFAGKAPLQDKVRRGVALATLLVVVFELMSFSSQKETFSLVLYFTFNIQESAIWPLVMMIIRLFLLILGAFFVISANEGIDAKKEAALEDGEDDEKASSESEDFTEIVVETLSEEAEQAAEAATEVTEPEVVLPEDDGSKA